MPLKSNLRIQDDNSLRHGSLFRDFYATPLKSSQ
jgi:hypothetical protein